MFSRAVITHMTDRTRHAKIFSSERKRNVAVRVSQPLRQLIANTNYYTINGGTCFLPSDRSPPPSATRPSSARTIIIYTDARGELRHDCKKCRSTWFATENTYPRPEPARHSTISAYVPECPTHAGRPPSVPSNLTIIASRFRNYRFGTGRHGYPPRRPVITLN